MYNLVLFNYLTKMSLSKEIIESKECPTDETLELFFQKEIEGRERKNIIEHVMSCIDCVMKLLEMSQNDKK
jgi:hypothetical protein